MHKNKSAAVTVTFQSPSFIHKGKKYLSKDVEAAAEEGDEEAQLIIAELVKKGSGIISIQEEGQAPAAPKNPKPPKAPKAPKAPKEPKAPKAPAADPEAGENKKEGQDA